MNEGIAVTITVDGRQLQLEDPRQKVADVLRLAGLDPAGYNLGEMKGGRPEPKVLEDDKTITIKDGDEFVSIREEATVA